MSLLIILITTEPQNDCFFIAYHTLMNCWPEGVEVVSNFWKGPPSLQHSMSMSCLRRLQSWHCNKQRLQSAVQILDNIWQVSDHCVIFQSLIFRISSIILQYWHEEGTFGLLYVNSNGKYIFCVHAAMPLDCQFCLKLFISIYFRMLNWTALHLNLV